MASIKELVMQFKDGEVAIADLEAALRSEDLGKVKKGESAADVTADPGVPKDDSFFWIGLLYNLGLIDDDEYNALAEAAAEE